MTNDEKFAALLTDNPAAFEKAPLAALTAAGIPLVDRAPAQSRRAGAQGSRRPNGGVPPPPIAAAIALIEKQTAATAAPGEHVSAELYWWGIDVICNEKMTSDIINGTVTVGVLGGALTVAFGALSFISGGAAAVIGAGLAAAFALKVYEMQLVDDGNGVYWPISWPQCAGLVASAAGGPVGLTGGAMLWLHPVRN
jgi:hypothetical protein